MRGGTPPLVTPAPAPAKPGAEAPPAPPPRASVDLESPFAVEASEGALGLLARLVAGLADGSVLRGAAGAAPSPLLAPSLAALMRIARATLRRGVASGVSLAVAGFAAPPGGGGSSDKVLLGAGKPSAALLDLVSAVQVRSRGTRGARAGGGGGWLSVDQVEAQGPVAPLTPPTPPPPPPPRSP